jgi:hypothetical protein
LLLFTALDQHSLVLPCVANTFAIHQRHEQAQKSVAATALKAAMQEEKPTEKFAKKALPPMR